MCCRLLFSKHPHCMNRERERDVWKQSCTFIYETPNRRYPLRSYHKKFRGTIPNRPQTHSLSVQHLARPIMSCMGTDFLTLFVIINIIHSWKPSSRSSRKSASLNRSFNDAHVAGKTNCQTRPSLFVIWIISAFRFPPRFPISSAWHVSTQTFVLRVEVLPNICNFWGSSEGSPFCLLWRRLQKQNLVEKEKKEPINFALLFYYHALVYKVLTH